jgi:hypothetical protein
MRRWLQAQHEGSSYEMVGVGVVLNHDGLRQASAGHLDWQALRTSNSTADKAEKYLCTGS